MSLRSLIHWILAHLLEYYYYNDGSWVTYEMMEIIRSQSPEENSFVGQLSSCILTTLPSQPLSLDSLVFFRRTFSPTHYVTEFSRFSQRSRTMENQNIALQSRTTAYCASLNHYAAYLGNCWQNVPR